MLASYGEHRYLKQAIASVYTLRRYDADRPVALFAAQGHRDLLRAHDLEDRFQHVEPLPEAHRSIVGVKHHLGRFKPFDRTLWTDVDVLWCRDPDPLWSQLEAYDFTITGLQSADHWFGAAKGPSVLADLVFRRRARTLRRFGLTYLPRVQSGLIYASDDELTDRVCERARSFLARRAETHFRSRLSEAGRALESCEWSLAMAMSDLDVPVLPWLQGQQSPQLDYISAWTNHDLDFREVRCRYYCDEAVYALRGLRTAWMRRLLLGVLTAIPGRGDWMEVTPYALHFGWMHEKEPLDRFAEQIWNRETTSSSASTPTAAIHG